MATNSKNSEKNNYTNGLPKNKLFQTIGMSMMSILPILLAAQVSTLEVPNQNQSVESRSNEAEHIIIAIREQGEEQNEGGGSN